MAAAAIPEGMAPVAVYKDLDGGIVPEVIVSAEELCAVEGFDPDFFAAVAAHNAADPADVFGYCVILVTLEGSVRSSMLLRMGIKGLSICEIAEQNDERNQQNQGNYHTVETTLDVLYKSLYTLFRENLQDRENFSLTK